MQFHVPQFIEVESKIFGPLTFKQFAYLIGGGGIVFILHSLLPLFFTVILGIPIIILSIFLAFLKIHGKPFVKVSENAIKYIAAEKLYAWKNPSSYRKIKKEAEKKEIKEPEYLPRLTENKLQELSWSLDIKEKIK